MPAGLPYFAWIDAGETAFTAGHMRWDESIFSFTLSQDEGDPASLTVVVRRPVNVSGDAIGLLGPGRKIWCWFALDCGPDLIRFRGRLVGIPTSIFEELVTLEFVARPVDVVAQKEALAASLRVLPYYDEAVIDEARRTDPDVVLEGYTAIWHYDRETHAVTVSDEITGEDGLVTFDGDSDTGKVLYDGLALQLSSGPLARVDVNAEYTWTQQARGSVDLTNYLVSHWTGNVNGAIQLNAADWPKRGAALGDGWEVEDSFAVDQYDYTVHSKTFTTTYIVKNFDGSGSQVTDSETVSSFTPFLAGTLPDAFRPSIGVGVVSDKSQVSYDDDHNVTSVSRNYSSSKTNIVFQYIKPTLLAGYITERQCTERVSFSLFADVQPILTDPEDGEMLRIDDVRSVNLTESGDIGDARRRSYIATERGNRSLEHLIALARAKLMMRSRAVEISFAPKLARMPEITLRKSAFLAEPRVGEALGKIIGYSIALDGSDGRIDCEVRIGCTIGRGGAATLTDGSPVYCSIAYVGHDYQQFVGRTVALAGGDTSVGYQPPSADPNDDGINFLGGLSADDVIDSDLVVEFGPDPNEPEDTGQPAGWDNSVGADNAAARDEYYKNAIKQYQVRAKFKLISMTRDFSTDYQLQVTDLKIPTGYNLEAT